MTIATGDTVTAEYTGRLENGAVFDTSIDSVAEEAGLSAQQPHRDFEPFTVEIGAGRIIDGLEAALIGMEEGKELSVRIPPEKAYGEQLEERVEDYDADRFSQMLGKEATEGMPIEMEDRGRGHIAHVDAEVIRVDFNHELAGETLEFDIEIVAVEKHPKRPDG